MYMCEWMCRHTHILRMFLLHVKVYFVSVVHPCFFPHVPLPQMPECAYPLCVLAFRNTPACSFHTIPNLCCSLLPTSLVPFSGAGLPPSQTNRTWLSLFLLRVCSVAAQRPILRLSLALGTECACQSQANPAHVPDRFHKARDKIFFKAPYGYSRRLHVIPVVILPSFQDSRKTRNPTVCFLSSPERQKPLSLQAVFPDLSVAGF